MTYPFQRGLAVRLADGRTGAVTGFALGNQGVRLLMVDVAGEVAQVPASEARRIHDCGRAYSPSDATYCWFCQAVI